jgi:hypothetical protein
LYNNKDFNNNNNNNNKMTHKWQEMDQKCLGNPNRMPAIAFHSSSGYVMATTIPAVMVVVSLIATTKRAVWCNC